MNKLGLTETLRRKSLWRRQVSRLMDSGSVSHTGSMKWRVTGCWSILSVSYRRLFLPNICLCPDTGLYLSISKPVCSENRGHSWINSWDLLWTQTPWALMMAPNDHVCLLKLVHSRTSMPNYAKTSHNHTTHWDSSSCTLVRKSVPRLSHSAASELFNGMGGVISASGWSYLSWGACVECREHMDRMLCRRERERERERERDRER